MQTPRLRALVCVLLVVTHAGGCTSFRPVPLDSGKNLDEVVRPRDVLQITTRDQQTHSVVVSGVQGNTIRVANHDPQAAEATQLEFALDEIQEIKKEGFDAKETAIGVGKGVGKVIGVGLVIVLLPLLLVLMLYKTP